MLLRIAFLFLFLSQISYAGGEQKKQGEKVDIGGTIMHHITNGNDLALPFIGTVYLPQFEPIKVGGIEIDLSITRHVLFMWIVAFLLLLIFGVLARPKLIPKGLYNFFESIVVFIRDEVVRPNLGAATDRFVGYFLTLFFFVLFMNLMGLVPYGATATGNITVTGILAIFTFFITQYAAIQAHGIGHYLKHLTAGVHWSLWIIMIPVEVIGLFTKPFALAIRLFANMTAGHVVDLIIAGYDLYPQDLHGGSNFDCIFFVYVLARNFCGLSAGIYIHTAFSCIYWNGPCHRS